MSGQDALVKAAHQARQRAYAPYSKFFVGAAVQLRDGRIFPGANVENCSYGLAICAERVAMVTAVVAGAKPGDVAQVAVVIDAPTIASPCGACRQFLAEFAPLGTPVVLHNLRDGATQHCTIGELLPHAFTPASLEA